MGSGSCEVFFNVNDPTIPAVYKEEFIEWAKTAGKPDEMDSCDIKESGLPARYTLINKSDYMKNSGNTSSTGYVGTQVFDYDKLHALFLRAKYGINITARSIEAEKSSEDLASILAGVPSSMKSSAGLINAIGDLFQKYPIRQSTSTCISGLTPETLMGGLPAFGTAIPIFGYRRIDIIPEQQTYLITTISQNYQIEAHYYDKDGNELCYLTVDNSYLMRTDQNPFGLEEYIYRNIWDRGSEKTKEYLGSIPRPISTNMTQAQWQVIKTQLNDGDDLFDQATVEKIEEEISK